MKYILQEQKYILNEETAQETIINAINKVKDRLAAAIEKIPTDTSKYESNKQTVDKLTNLADEIELAEDPVAVQAKINEYVTLFKQATGKILNLNQFPEINNLLREITNAVLPIDKPIKKSDVAYLKNKLDTFNKIIPTTTLLPTDASSINAIQQATNTTKENLDKLIKNVDLITGNTKEALQVKQDLNTLFKSIPAASNIGKNNYTDITNACETFNNSQAVNKIIENEMAVNKAAEEEAARKAAEEEAEWKATEGQYTYNNVKNNRIDLDNEYKNLKTKDAVDSFWQRYFIEFWGDKAEKIKSLGNTFRQEVTKISFDPELNYFIDYLRKVIDIVQPKSYDAIHNAIISKDLEDKDLLGQGKFGKNNIIFNADFLSKSLEDCTELLKLQNNLEERSIAKDPNEVNIFYTQDNKIAPVTVIKKEIAKLTNNSKEIATDTFIDSVLQNKANEDAIFLAAIDMLMPNSEAYKKVIDKNPEINTRYTAAVTKLGSNLAKSKSNAYNSILKTNSKKFSTEQLVKIINAIANNKQNETK